LQVQSPADEHPSPELPQAWHAPPLVPQAVAEGEMHAPLEQQPPGQEFASHLHDPDTHSRPAPHAAPLPHVQLPEESQPLAPAPHDAQAAPAAPHAFAFRVVHTAPVQQPFGHVVGLHPVHAPPLQIWAGLVVGHALHSEPPVPHAFWSLPATHWLLDVQHPEHDVVSQTQCPPEQCCPVPQASPPPHVHAPADEQPSPVVPQLWQVSPPVPHAGPVAGDVQTLPVQHPPAQDVASHTQVPIEQR
jgi:hypothetical protein